MGLARYRQRSSRFWT